MEIVVSKSKLTGQIEIPGSKSHTIRAIVMASMASGTSTLKMPLVSDDTISCLRAASALGAWIKRGDDTVWRISGTSGHLLCPAHTIDMGNSGTGLRLFAAQVARSNEPISFDGDESLRSRDMASLLEALETMGAKVTSSEGRCPLTIQGPVNGTDVIVDGKTSQFVSALLFTAPLLEHDTVIRVQHLCEKPYVVMTLNWYHKQGIKFEVNEEMSRFKIFGGQKYKPFSAQIPVDFSTATFPLLGAAITGSEITIPQLDFNDIQGDKLVFDYFRQMGVKVSSADGITTIKGPRKLKCVDVDLNATPDALPAMAVAAACAEGTSYLRNVPQARMKESDRIACMTRELRKMGANVEELQDGMVITGGKLSASKELESYRDHRIAMALTVAGMSAEGKSVIRDGEWASVTYPEFFEAFKALGANISEMSI